VKQDSVAAVAQSVLSTGRGRRTRKLLSKQSPFVVFTSCEKPATGEVVMRVSDAQREDPRLSLPNEELWEVQRTFARVIFFVYDDGGQARRYECSPGFDGVAHRNWARHSQEPSSLDMARFHARTPTALALTAQQT
jgi:hypothetical protein